MPDEATVVLRAVHPAPPAALYKAFTDATLLARWWWPANLAATYDIDPTVNGSFRIRSTTQELGIEATFREVVPEERIRLQWQWEFDPTVTEVLIEFRPHGGGTDLTVTHGQNPGVLSREENRVGWADCLGRLLRLDLGLPG